jgi:single-strand DNA-binding protein
MSSYSSLNKVMLLGRLGRDPEIKYSAAGTAICNISVATSENIKKGNDFEEKTEWHRIVVFGSQAENTSKFLKKGSLVFIEGRIQYRSYQDKDGNDKYVTEIIANMVRFLDLKESGGSDRTYQSSSSPAAKPESSEKQPSEPTSIDNEEDDLPF